MSTDSSRETRLDALLADIRELGGKWTAGRVHKRRRRTGGPVQRGTARRDLIELARRGYLDQHGSDDGRFYTLITTKDGAS